jgi:hypothetical protein
LYGLFCQWRNRRLFLYGLLPLLFLTLFIFGRVTETPSRYTGSFAHCLIDAILNKNSKFNSNAFRILNNSAMAEDSFHLVLC